MERADDLVDSRARPDLEERRLLERGELAVGALAGLLRRLARPRAADATDHGILVIDRRELDVVIEVLQIPRIEHRDGNRLPRASVLVVEELRHDVGVAVRRLGQARSRAAAEFLAIPREDAQ